MALNAARIAEECLCCRTLSCDLPDSHPIRKNGNAQCRGCLGGHLTLPRRRSRLARYTQIKCTTSKVFQYFVVIVAVAEVADIKGAESLHLGDGGGGCCTSNDGVCWTKWPMIY